LKAKKYLVFGSNGFVGSHLVAFLTECGNNVVGCDIQEDSNNPNIGSYFRYKDDEDFLFDMVDNDIDICVNCAGSASVPHSFENPFIDYELNTRIVFRILCAINKTSDKCKFINLSSAAVYGNPESNPIHVDAPRKPVSPYGNHKMMSELICNQFRDYFDVDTCSLRIFSAYGNGLRKQLFWDLYQKARSSEKISVWGTGNESRDFIHIDDLVRVIQLVADQDSFSKHTYNVGNGAEIYIKDAVESFYSAYDSSLEYAFTGEVRKGDPVNWEADITGIKALGYSPTVDIKDGLARYAAWAKEN